jgi:16S rRNA pseudouridine516 synthase
MNNKQRLDKILRHMGYGTRKEIKKMLKQEIVSVDGNIIKDSGIHVNPNKSIIMVNGEQVYYKEYIYIMMNKPKDVISASYDLRETTVVDLLSKSYESYQLFPVGRLDKDTEGLLLLTNDGKLSHNLLSPKKHVPKTYYAKIEGSVNAEDVCLFEEGVVLDDGYKTLPAQLIILKEEDHISEIEITIYEGKFHQVKRMFKSLGKQVIYLKRIAMGPLKLDETLGPGMYRELTEKEIDILTDV